MFRLERARIIAGGAVVAAMVALIAGCGSSGSSNVAARPVIQAEETETLRREQLPVGPDSDEITKLA